MFKRKICGRCGRSLKEKYDFCPHCGNALDRKKENLGMLGKDDFFPNDNSNELRFPIGFNMVFNSLMKNLEKQFKAAEKKPDKPENKKGNISISISTFGDKLPVVKVNSLPSGIGNLETKEVKSKSFDNLSSEKLKKFSKLPKEEPKTNIRRLSNKVIYEVDLPGVKSAKDISILNLEKGIELKAVSEKKAYLKSIPITLPILAYKLSKGKLFLELDAHED
jgi:HSP20 family molecular chaperone IbpA